MKIDWSEIGVWALLVLIIVVFIGLPIYAGYVIIASVNQAINMPGVTNKILVLEFNDGTIEKYKTRSGCLKCGDGYKLSLFSNDLCAIMENGTEKCWRLSSIKSYKTEDK